MMLLCTFLFVIIARVEAFSIVRVETFSFDHVMRPCRTALLASTQTTSDASRLKRIVSLTEWSKSAQIKLGGVGIAQSESGAGLGLLASQEVPSNTVVVSVPSSVSLSVESPGDGPDDTSWEKGLLEDRKVLRESPWFAQFAVYLFQLDKVSSIKRDTDMCPWLDSLPRSFDTPIHWTRASFDQLQYPHLPDAVARQKVEWKRLYDNLLAAGTPSLKKMTFDDFIWGCECARSRAFSGGYTGSAFNPLTYAFTLLLVSAYVGLNLGTLEQAANGAGLVVCASILKDFVLPKLFKKRKYVICPILDMCNHKSLSPSGDVSFEFFGDAYSITVSGQVSQGEEVYISYGTRSNDQLLQFYGFVERDNSHDVYVMPSLREWDIGALETACGRPFSPGRLQKLDRAGLLGTVVTSSETDGSSDGGGAANPSGGVVITRAGGIDPAVMQALRALVSTDQEWQDAGEAIGNFAAEMSGGAENERLARLAARTAIERELVSKPTTLKEDESLLATTRASKGMDASREEILAIEFRIEKKKLLAETLDTLS
jgi:hypothetical protein